MVSSSAVIAAADERCGKATWFDGSGLTASGERNSAGALTAAHRSLPFGTEVRVENLENGRSAVVRVNDRGSFKGSRIISVSRAAAEELGMISDGVAKVRLTVAGEDSLAGEACGAAPTIAAGNGGSGGEEPFVAPVAPASADVEPAVRTLPPVIVGISDGTASPEEMASEASAIASWAMAERFAAAHGPESWKESELRKLIEAMLPRYWRRGSALAPTAAPASAGADIPWPAFDGLTQVSVARNHIADLWSTELAHPASARFERPAGPTAVSLLTE